MKIECKTILEKSNLLLSILAGILMIAVYILYLLKPVESDVSVGYIIFRKTVIQLVDMIPFVLLVLFAFLQKTERFRRARYIPLILLGTRLFVDLLGGVAYISDYTRTLTFDMVLDAYYVIILLGLVAYALFAAFASRSDYAMFSVCFLLAYVYFCFWSLGDASLLRLLWAAASVLWYGALIGFCVTLTDDNSYGGNKHTLTDRILSEMVGYEEELIEDEEDDAAYEAYDPDSDAEPRNFAWNYADLQREYRQLQIRALYRDDHTALTAAEHLRALSEKHFLDADGAVYENAFLAAQYRVLLACAEELFADEPEETPARLTVIVRNLLDSYETPEFRANAYFLAMVLYGTIDFAWYHGFMSFGCSDTEETEETEEPEEKKERETP